MKASDVLSPGRLQRGRSGAADQNLSAAAKLLLSLAEEDGCITVALELAGRIQQQQWLVSSALVTARPLAHLGEPLCPNP